MKITLRYSIITKEGTVIPNVIETFDCPDEESKKPARDRFAELKSSYFVANLEFKIEEIPMRRIVKARYNPRGTLYTFEVDFPVRAHQGLEVDDLDRPGFKKYVIAAEPDKVVPEAELGFDPQRLRKAYKAK